MKELLASVVGAIEPGEGGGVVAVQIFQRGGFVGTKCFVERVFDLGADVDGGGEVLQDRFFGKCLRAGVGAEVVGYLSNGFVVFRREFEGLVRAEIVSGRIKRAFGFAFGSTRSGGPLGIAPVRC